MKTSQDVFYSSECERLLIRTFLEEPFQTPVLNVWRSRQIPEVERICLIS